MSLAEFVYTVVLKPKPLKAAANRMIRTILPRTVECGPIHVVINPTDPVVSGALAFGVYERGELAFVNKSIRPGMTVLDIGANVGLYTALAGNAAGPQGRVIAFEPDPESFGYLQRTIQENGLKNVEAVNAAASDTDKESWLYTSSSNRGDSRLYDNELSDNRVQIRQIRLDDFLPTLGIRQVDFIKMDVQGFEGHVLSGMKEIIRNSPKLVMMSEFWPDGLQRAGSDPHEVLTSLEQLGLQLFELDPKGNTCPLVDKGAFIARCPGRKYANICAVKSA